MQHELYEGSEVHECDDVGPNQIKSILWTHEYHNFLMRVHFIHLIFHLAIVQLIELHCTLQLHTFSFIIIIIEWVNCVTGVG